MKPYPTTAPSKIKWSGGYSSGDICPKTIADKLFGEEIPGPWLCCYMLRRFGWPNEGSDCYKSLMSWALTTPIEGLFLSVTPYLGGSNLHFGVRFSEAIGRKLRSDPGSESYWRRQHKAVMGWWKSKGIKLYAWGCGLKDGDRDELVHHFCDSTTDKSMCFGLWRRTKKMTRKGDIPQQAQMQEWWLSRLIKAKHPEVRLPKMTAKEKLRMPNPFHRQAEQALRRVMLDLLRPTNVRDVDFNCFGRTEQGAKGAVKPSLIRSPGVAYWDGAGHTPAYYYSAHGQKTIAAERKKV